MSHKEQVGRLTLPRSLNETTPPQEILFFARHPADIKTEDVVIQEHGAEPSAPPFGTSLLPRYTNILKRALTKYFRIYNP